MMSQMIFLLSAILGSVGSNIPVYLPLTLMLYLPRPLVTGCICLLVVKCLTKESSLTQSHFQRHEEVSYPLIWYIMLLCVVDMCSIFLDSDVHQLTTPETYPVSPCEGHEPKKGKHLYFLIYLLCVYSTQSFTCRLYYLISCHAWFSQFQSFF